MSIDNAIIYYSKHNKPAAQYTKTQYAAYRYLVYRDIPLILQKYFKTGKALEFGSGTGDSAQYLYELGFEVVGADINQDMLQQAYAQYPHIPFYAIENGMLPIQTASMDLVFSSFVLMEISSKSEIIAYLLEAKRVMKKENALFMAITGSEYLHAMSKKWLEFSNEFQENHNLVSGNLVKLYHYSSHIEFADYYWTEADYRDCFSKTGFKILEMHFPLGKQNEPYAWQDELHTAPFIIFMATT